MNDKFFEQAEWQWLGIGDVTRIHTDDILHPLIVNDELEAAYNFLQLASDPNYLHMFVKEVLNVQLAPHQCVVIQELWNHKFPMFIATRGFSKCVSADTIIHTNNGFSKIGNHINRLAPKHTKIPLDMSLCGENGFNDIEYIWNDGVSDTYKIQSIMGFEIEGKAEHPLRVVQGNEIVWKNMEDIKEGDYIVIDRSFEWHENTNPKLHEDEAYLIGTVLGFNRIGTGSIHFKTKDEYFLSDLRALSIKWLDARIGNVFHPAKGYKIKSLKTVRGFKQKYGVVSNRYVTEIPEIILRSPRTTVTEFIKGLFDAGARYNPKDRSIIFKSKSKNLVKMLHFILTKYGIIAKAKYREFKYRKTYGGTLELHGEAAKKYMTLIGFRRLELQSRATHINKIRNFGHADIIPKELVVDHISDFTKKFIHGKNREFWRRNKRFTSKKLNKDNLSYTEFYRTFDLLASEGVGSSDPDFLRLKYLYEKKYYFDKVYKISRGRCNLYDFHLKTDHSFLTNGFISHNSFLLGVTCLLKCVLIPGTKVVLTGAGFRQAKLIFEYIQHIWDHAPILRDICNSDSGSVKNQDRWVFHVNDSTITAIPMGADGEKIRGMRANCIVTDEFSSLNLEVYEKVVQGFASVEADPIEKMKESARRELLIEHGAWSSDEQMNYDKARGNQSIIAGTAGYDFQHFADYWRRYRKILTGDQGELKRTLGEYAEHFSPADFCIIRFPYDLIPKGFMDDRQIARARATVHSGIFNMEYGAVFVKDSDGFFKRTLIEKAVAKPSNEIVKQCGLVSFDATLVGNPNGKYIIGVDPAAQGDNLAIVVLELYNDHWRIVYCWTTNSEHHKKAIREGITSLDNYYSYCARKIRDLMKIFPTVRVGIDGQGGGGAIIEALHDRAIMEPNEDQLWLIVDDDKPKDSDTKPGSHIIEKIEFANYEWTSEANNGLRKDIEMRFCLFPRYDGISLAMAAEKDIEAASGSKEVYDSLESTVAEIEELKNELSIIEMTTTTTGRNRWDTPEIKLPNSKKGRMRKDRYSALLIANMIARSMNRADPPVKYAIIGRSTKDFVESKDKPKNIYLNPNMTLDAKFFKAIKRK